MLVLTTERLALLALDPRLAALQAADLNAFFNAIAVAPAPDWPPPPFEPHALAWAADHLKHDPEGQGWYGWIITARDEVGAARALGIAALIGRPDDDGDVELAFGLTPEARGKGHGPETLRALAAWAFENGARRVISHLDAEDAIAAHTLQKIGFTDTRQPPYPGVAKWALHAAA